MRLVLLLALAALLGGCGAAEADKPRRSTKERQEAAEVKLGRTPVPRVYRYTDGELQVLEVPVKDGAGFVDQQRCFLWRDDTFKTASISCGQMPDVLLAN